MRIDGAATFHLLFFGLLLVLNVLYPEYVGDQNAFLKDFIDQDVLSTLGVILAITLASAASIQMHLLRLHDESGVRWTSAKTGLLRSCNSLIILFGLAVVLVIAKPFADQAGQDAIINSVVLGIVFMNLSILHDIVATVFAIRSVRDIREYLGDVDEKRSDSLVASKLPSRRPRAVPKKGKRDSPVDATSRHRRPPRGRR